LIEFFYDEYEREYLMDLSSLSGSGTKNFVVLGGYLPADTMLNIIFIF
jgi:hypothetical protein